MSRTWFQFPLLRMMLIIAGLAFVLSGCHLHHGHAQGGYGYHGGGHGGGHYRGHGGYKRDGNHRGGGRRGGWRGRS